MSLLQSGDRAKEEEGIRRHQCGRGEFMRSFPQDAKWYSALLKIDEGEFGLLRTITSEGWEKYSKGSYLLCAVARYLLAHPCEDKRVTSIVHEMRSGAVEINGITLLARSRDGPYTIAEGNARLVAVYINCIVNDLPFRDGDSIEVILGLSSSKWICAAV